MKVIVPTCKGRSDESVVSLAEEIQKTVPGVELTVTGWPVSASINRNYGLYRSGVADDEVVIMIDDDITDLYDGWADDLIKPLYDDPDVLMASARLMGADGRPGIMVGDNYDIKTPVVKSIQNQLPTACVAFRTLGCRFDESYIGSGFEDNDYCHQLFAHNVDNGSFVIVNTCRLTHKNDMKNQGGDVWKQNEAYYKRKWGIA